MSILNVNQIQPVGGGNTITVSASDVNFSGNISIGSSFVGTASTATLATTAILANTATVATNAQGLTGTPDITVNNIQSGVVTATTFIGDGSGITGVTASGSGINIKDSASTVGVAATIDFGTNLNVSPASAGIVTVTVGDTDFSIVDKIVHTGDTNTAIRFPAADTITAETNSEERLRITSIGNVGIGTDDPLRQLDIFSTGHATAALKGNTQSSLFFVDNDDSNIGQISYIHADNYMYFRVNDAERLRIKSNGDLKHTGLRSGGGDNKLAILVTPSHNTNEEDVIVYQVENESSSNQITFGGGTSAYNAATQILFKTASAVDTTGGTERLRISSDGSVGIGTDNPSDDLSILADPNSLVIGAKDSTRTNHVFQLLADDPAGNGELRLYKNSATGTHEKTVEIAASGNSYINSGSNFGIGQDNPQSKLQIENAGEQLRLTYPSVASYIHEVKSDGDYAIDKDGTEKLRIQSGGGISFNGDTAAANALDDYEEGTFTPQIFGLTISSSYGHYVKVGSLVTCVFYIDIGTKTYTGSESGTTALQIILPFTNNNVTNSYAGASIGNIRYIDFSSNSVKQFAMNIGGVSDRLTGRWVKHNSNFVNVFLGDLYNSFSIHASVTYRAA